MDAQDFLQLAGALPEPMLLLTADGQVVAANPAARAELGEDPGGKSIFELVADPAEKISRYLRLWARSRELVPGAFAWRGRPGGEGRRCEGALVRRRSAEGPALVLVRCRPKQVTTGRFLALNEKIELLAKEVTERKRAEAALEAQREWLRTALSSIGDGVIVTDCEGRVTFLNPVAQELTGWSSEEAAGQPLEHLFRIIDESSREPLENPVVKVLREGFSGPESGHTVLMARDGAERAIDERGAPIRDDQGGILGVVLVFRDVTQRKKAEEQVRQTQKLESLGLLAGGVAHDFNNLLTGILGNASLALQAVPVTSPARRMLEQVIAAGQRAADLTRQMLAYAGRGRFVIEPVNVSNLIAEIGSLIRTSIPKTVDLRLELADGLPPVEADASQLQQVVMNLVINAAEAVGDGRAGTVFVRTGARQIDQREVRKRFAQDGIAPGTYVWLEVRDDGCGMDDATRSRIFDPFFTTKFTGRGLGLAAALGIVRSHRGAIKVFSTPGRGSTFQVFLLAAAREPREAERPRADFSGAGNGPGRG